MTMVWTVFFLAFTGLVAMQAMDDLRKPTCLRGTIRKQVRICAAAFVFSGLVISGLTMAIVVVANRAESRGASDLEFASGMTQALERVAYLRGGNSGMVHEWAGRDRNGSRYALLRDEAGPFVRVENLLGHACIAILSYLSPYASSVLVMKDERGLSRLDDKDLPCPGGDGRIQAVFRAAAT